MKAVSLLLVLALLTLSLAACGGGAAREGSTDFTVEELTITLPDTFAEHSTLQSGQTAAFLSHDSGVLVLRESLETLAEVGLATDISLTEYASIIMENGSVRGEPVTENGLTYFTYASPADGINYTYLATVFRSENAYWLVQFYCPTKVFEERRATLLEYAATVTFAEGAS